MVKEAWQTRAAAKVLPWLGRGFQWARRVTPGLLKGKLSVPLRNAAGTWTKDTGKILENLGKFGGKHLKNTRASGFFEDLADLGGQTNRFGVRQKAVAGELWKPSEYSKWYHYANPLKWGNSLGRNIAEAGLSMNPLYYGPGILTSRKTMLGYAPFLAAGPLGNMLDTSYRYTPIQRDPMIPMRNLRYQDIIRRGRQAVR